MKHIYTLKNTIQQYAWGSTDGIMFFTGSVNPEGKPLAELWMGAHPGAPSRTTAESGTELGLDDLISANQETMLGQDVSAKYGRLPYLFKVLSAGAPLSLQVHPNKHQAETGFSRDNAANIPISAGNRNYKDDNHKPEIIVAVTPFLAMCGFRAPEETKQLFSILNVSGLHDICIEFTKTASYTGLCRSLLGLAGTEKNAVMAEIHERIKTIRNESARVQTLHAIDVVAMLLSHYPDDIGVLAPLYLNVIELAPGEGIYLPAGIMHAYLRGTGLELMANSDNVLRGGLTPKHIDVPELLSILDPTPYRPEILSVANEPGRHAYTTPSREFELSKLVPAGSIQQFEARNPAILIGGNDDGIMLEAANDTVRLGKGVVVFIPATGETVQYSGSGTAYMASLPES
jgi:mannose-6-phosphate isomerase